MMRAFKLYTGTDNASHVLEGTIDEKDRTDVVAIHFKKTPAHSSYDWHPDPEPHVGKGHKWRLIDDQPWRRAYVVLKPGAKDSFVANATS